MLHGVFLFLCRDLISFSAVDLIVSKLDLLKFVWWAADIFALHSIAVKIEKWIYPTISAKLTPFSDSDFENPVYSN